MADPDTTRDPALDEFLCFAVYSANLAISRTYRPLLERLGVTYLQYLVLVALWERDAQLVGALCDRVFLTTSTITPVIKKLERMALVTRERRSGDDRQVSVELTDRGRALRETAAHIPGCIVGAAGLPRAQLDALVDSITGLRDVMLVKARSAPAPTIPPRGSSPRAGRSEAVPTRHPARASAKR